MLAKRGGIQEYPIYRQPKNKNLYKTTMKLGWDMLAREELVHVQTQVPEIREKAGFIKH